MMEEMNNFDDDEGLGGARPKGLSIPSQKTFFIRYHTNFQTGSYDTGTLTIGSASFLKFEGDNDGPDTRGTLIHINNLRWISKYQYMEQPAKFCIIISFRDNNEKVNNLFISPCVSDDKKCLDGTPQDAEFITCFDRLSEFYQMHKFRNMPEIGSKKMNDVMALVAKQPIFQGCVSLTVRRDSGGDLVYTDQLMLLDVECVVWYGQQLHKPAHTVAFWKEPSDVSVETVKVFHSDGKMELQTKLCSYVIPVVEEIQQNLRYLISKTKDFMCDADALVAAASIMNFPGRTTPPAFTLPSGTSEWTERSTLQPGASGWGDGSTSDARITLKETFDAVKRNFFGVEDFQLQWLTIQYDLEEIIAAGEVPLSDAGSGGLDPNNNTHLEKAMSDVEDQMKDNDFRVALSRIEAVRETFQDSKVPWVQDLFQDTNMELLKCIYFKSLCT